MSTEPVIISFAPPLEEFRERARNAVMSHFVEIALKDRRPPTQRAMDAVKSYEARLMLMPGSTYVSPYLMQEAAIRNAAGQPITVQQLAGAIEFECAKCWQIELDRIEVSLAVDKAIDHVAIVQALADKGIEISA